jgi:hypothetical protein
MWLAGAAALLSAACASGGHPAAAQETPVPRAAAPQHTATQLPGLVRPGFGTLRQDAFTVSLRSDALLVKVTPLAESVIRLAAPDTYTRLHALAESRRAAAAQRLPGGSPQLVLVSFFSYQPDVPYQPEDVQLTAQGRTLRPAAILPVTATWGAPRLAQQETQAAVYVFDAVIDYEQPLTVRYGMQQSDAWTDIVAALDTERGKVQARAANAPQ